MIAALRNQFGGHAVKLESGESSGVSFSPDEKGGAWMTSGQPAGSVGASTDAAHVGPRTERWRCHDAAPQPFARGLRLQLTPEPCIMVIFGATGDLTMRKLVPALYNLALQGLLPTGFSLVGVARRPYDRRASSAQQMHDAVKSFRAAARCSRRSGTRSPRASFMCRRVPRSGGV